MMARVDGEKWYLPGWRIEQRYSPGVLIGNWAEERNVFQKNNIQHNSTNRIDFRNFGSHRPDVLIRRSALVKHEGVGPQNLFHHHGKRYSNNMVSWYDEDYNGRWREKGLPEIRDWDGHRLAWVPEKSDFPVEGRPTNFGLFEQVREKQRKQIAEESRGSFLSTYSASYNSRSPNGLVSVRYANPREHSTTLHKYNHINKDLNLRNTSSVKSPEKLAAEMVEVSC